MFKAHLLLEDGTIFDAEANLADKTVLGELVFNTSMTGYQEILTDSSYTSQIVVLTYPLIGNYGIKPEFSESKSIKAEAVIIKENSETETDGIKSFSDYLSENNKLCLSNIDTRNLTKIIRSCGCLNCLITTDNIKNSHYDMLKEYSFPKNLVSKVSVKDTEVHKSTTSKITNFALIDCGSKDGIIKELTKLGAEITVYPFNTDYNEILKGKHNAVIISNGPGNPKDVPETIQTVENLIDKIPVFGICLGHQIIALALGADTEKMKFGHRGGNHPVINLKTDKVMITSQNHGYTVIEKSLPNYIEITFKNVNDGSIEGLKHKNLPVQSVQFHPEGNPGPLDSHSIFNDWIEIAEREAKNA